MKQQKNPLLTTVIILLFNFCYCQAQDTLSLTYKQVVDTFFKALDKTKITTGILIERAPAFIQHDKMDGKHPEHIINRDSVLEFYGELYYGHFNFDTLTDALTLDTIAQRWQQQNENIIPLMLLNYKYDKIKDSAWFNNWLTVENLQLKDNTPTGQTPYETKTAFALAPFVKGTNDFSATFMLPSQFIMSNSSYDELLIDFNDGLGLQMLNVNQPISVSFPFNEIASITVKAIKGTDTLTSNSTFTLPSSNAVFQISSIEVPDSCSLVVNGIKHNYGVWPSCESSTSSFSNGCTKTDYCIRKPLIIVEGYDPYNSRFLYNPGPPHYPDLGFDHALYAVANEHGLADKMRAAGYDIVILNFHNGLDALEDQAEVLKALLRELKTKTQACGSNEEFVILGPSSGGLIARYALADMEGNGEDHHTRLFISFDAPNQGANIPLSLQHLVRFLTNTFPLNLPFIAPIQQLKQIFNAPPTKEMLVYHAEETSNFLAHPASEFNNFFTTINGLNNGHGYPLKCRNIAISEGRGDGVGYNFSPGDKLFGFNPILGLFNIISTGWAVPNKPALHTVFAGNATLCVPVFIPNPFFPPFPPPLIFIGTTCFPTNVALFAVINTDPYDNAPGGQGDFIESTTSGLGPFADCKVNPCRQDFIPTTSALDLKNTNNLFYNVQGNITGNDRIAFKGIDYASSVSPFDAIYVSADNLPHVIDKSDQLAVTQDMANFIWDDIMPVDLFLQNRTVTDAVDFEALQTITAGNNVQAPNRTPPGDFIVANTADVNFRAGQEIRFKPGFHAQAGSNFHAYIQPFPIECNAQYRIAENNNHNHTSSSSQPISIADMVLKEVKEPGKIISVHCFPNPFTDHTHIDYSVKEIESVNISVYNASGMKVADLVNNNNHPAGNFTTTLDARKLSTGIYCMSIQINDKREVVKIIKSQ